MVPSILKILILVKFSLSAWYDNLDSGSIEGYLSPSEVTSYFSSLGKNDPFKESSLIETFNNNSIKSYTFSAKSKD